MVSPNKMSEKRRVISRHGYNKRYKGNFQLNNVPNANGCLRLGMDIMFSASQIPDNPGYVDFNDPSPPMPNIVASNKSLSFDKPIDCDQNQGKGRRQFNPTNNCLWNGPAIRSNQIPQFGPSVRNFRNPGRPLFRPMIPQIPPMAIRTPMPPHLPQQPPKRFNIRPNMIPPMRHPCPSLPRMNPHYSQSLNRGRVNMALPPQNSINQAKSRNSNICCGTQEKGNKEALNKNKTVNGNRKRLQSSSSKNKKIVKKTLKEIVNQYPLDKPWVTSEIRNQQQIKNDIENKLKCYKNDELFAKFKIHRDKFVKMYEAAKLEYIGKHPEQDIDKIMTESDKTKGANTNKTN